MNKLFKTGEPRMWGGEQPSAPPINSGQYFSGSASVKQMQQAMIDFTKVLETSGGFPANDQSVAGEEKQRGAGQERSKGYGAFIDWLLVNYTQKTQKGSQFISPFKNSPSDVLAKKRMDSAIPVKMSDDLLKYIYSIRILGKHTAKGEFQPDGIWQVHTNNAVKNTYSIAYSIVNLINSLGLQNQIKDFGPKRLARLGQLVTDDAPKDPKVKEKNAKEITDLVQRLSTEFQTFNNFIIQQPGLHGGQVSQEKPFGATYGKEKATESLSAEEYLIKSAPDPKIGEGFTSVYNNLKSQPLVGLKSDLSSKSEFGDRKLITLENISSMQSFKQYLDSNKIMFNGANASSSNEGVKAALDYIYNQLIKAPSQMNTLTGTQNQDYGKPASIKPQSN